MVWQFDLVFFHAKLPLTLLIVFLISISNLVPHTAWLFKVVWVFSFQVYQCLFLRKNLSVTYWENTYVGYFHTKNGANVGFTLLIALKNVFSSSNFLISIYNFQNQKACYLRKKVIKVEKEIKWNFDFTIPHYVVA